MEAPGRFICCKLLSIDRLAKHAVEDERKLPVEFAEFWRRANQLVDFARGVRAHEKLGPVSRGKERAENSASRKNNSRSRAIHRVIESLHHKVRRFSPARKAYDCPFQTSTPETVGGN